MAKLWGVIFVEQRSECSFYRRGRWDMEGREQHIADSLGGTHASRMMEDAFQRRTLEAWRSSEGLACWFPLLKGRLGWGGGCGVEINGRSLRSFQRVLTSHWKMLEKKEGLIRSLEEKEILLNWFLKRLSGELKLIQEESNLVRAGVLERQCSRFRGVVGMPVRGPLPHSEMLVQSLRWATRNHIFNRCPRWFWCSFMGLEIRERFRKEVSCELNPQKGEEDQRTQFRRNGAQVTIGVYLPAVRGPSWLVWITEENLEWQKETRLERALDASEAVVVGNAYVDGLCWWQTHSWTRRGGETHQISGIPTSL